MFENIKQKLSLNAEKLESALSSYYDYTDSDYNELIEVLKGLGYKLPDINKILPSIKSEKVEDQVKEALKLMLK